VGVVREHRPDQDHAGPVTARSVEADRRFQGTIARICDVDARRIHQPRIGVVYRVAEALNVTIDRLLIPPK
jgi:hypothetical protein